MHKVGCSWPGGNAGRASNVHGIKREAKTMAEKLKEVECDPKCGFKVRSHDEKEILAIAIEHGKKAHNMTITEQDVRGMLKDA
jgi:predicted small metal-binding protein